MYPVCLSSDNIPIREASKINSFKKYAPHLLGRDLIFSHSGYK